MDIGSSKDIQDFFAACRDVGFFGEDRRFVLVSLSFNAFNIADEGQQQQQQPNIVSNGDKFSKSFVFLRLVDPSNPIAKAISEKLRPRTNIRKRDEDPPIREFEVDDALRRKKNSRILMDYSDNLRPTLEVSELKKLLFLWKQLWLKATRLMFPFLSPALRTKNNKNGNKFYVFPP